MTKVYYNDSNAFCVRWLKNLIKEGCIPKGDVDDRSIKEVTSKDLKGYTQCHFFAGIAGWPLALRMAGWGSTEQVWTGSCPCQPFSVAGKNKGTKDDRHLWPEFKRLIQEGQPTTVFGEQVASKAGRVWLSNVRSDLEALGYGFGAADLCAAGIKAPHVRQRLWWVADSQWDQRKQSRYGQVRRMGRIKQSVSWDKSWESALREFRTLDDGLSYKVEAVDAPRNAIVPQLAAEFVMAFKETNP